MFVKVPTTSEDYLTSLPDEVKSLAIRLNAAQIKAYRGDGGALIEMANTRRALIEACERHDIDHKTICL